MPIVDSISGSMPFLLQKLIGDSIIQPNQVLQTKDGFCLINHSVASILSAKGIDTFLDKEGTVLECSHYFDDWFLYAVSGKSETVYGLVKMREQEFEQERGIQADGDTPGVTVSFIAFDVQVFVDCLENPSSENRRRLGIEINRVVAYPKQNHHPDLKAYFIRPQAEAPYLIAETYVNYIAQFSHAGTLEVPKAYTEIYHKRARSAKYSRIPDFLEQNNHDAGSIICDHQRIYIAEAEKLTEHEKLAIMATHTGNVSVHSFAAEIRYHAMFLNRLANIRLPFIGSPYASAVRADMSIGDKEFQGPTPYYNLSGKLVRDQRKYHKI